ncbi:peptidase S24/S26A/S26B/S26C [Blyttiomyces helicus]|uniref:Peptidase S24/S26A/S26B/S26C n=1 Tax=Blyttiomyces helicus TaxID=388810 RepID=A0A4P9WJG7_9FUNG|nr:peptidase S24/S26A/S26B/S26C [Blyttiomyces helicus]|eukprot:RKO91280.1 peptidase S24/S26A/S26B/S26C [Blyttiomyces helicus]
MLPTFNSIGDFVLVEHVSWRLRRVDVGDVVVAVSPTGPGKTICKRVLGMPGDRICIDPTVADRRFLTVPPGHVWLQGDNFSNSTDSRAYGPVPMGLLRGRVLCKVWPRFEWIENGLQPHEGAEATSVSTA